MCDLEDYLDLKRQLEEEGLDSLYDLLDDGTEILEDGSLKEKSE